MNIESFSACTPNLWGWPDPASKTTSTAPMLQVGIQNRTGGIAVLVVCGEIDITTAPVLAPYLRKVTADSGDLVLDLTGVPFLGCTGMALFDTAASRVRRRNATLTTAAQPQVRRILHLTGLDGTLGCCDTVDEALAAARRIRN
ncbi:STAS domain-containing protein [Rhodococcus oxybenzonivorans]|uniref:STAS domain-containing protein n=1 Tax=Rhodococcus oxybenzonivorans TaxID=1990687 RepID=UPI0013A58698|nr:STAS domain-containing protein [Rhodococcus oxybenzonivorans]